MLISLNMIQTLSVAVVVLLFGQWLCRVIPMLSRFCIPPPVIGGLFFSLLTLFGHQTGLFSLQMDMTLKDFFMIFFFTTIGFTASFKILKQGGPPVFIFLLAAVILVVLQDLVGLILAKAFSLNPLIGLSTGSVSMTGGHGTSAAFGPVFERMGAEGAYTVALAAATFGLIMGSMIGGPIAQRLITKRNLVNIKTNEPGQDIDKGGDDACVMVKHPPLEYKKIIAGFNIIAIAMGLGSLVSALLQKTGLSFPPYIGAMFVAAIIRNLDDISQGRMGVCMDSISTLGDLFLALFLSMALMSLSLWELADLAGPLVVMLLVQSVLMAIFALYVTFRFMGKDYDAAVITAGHCGFSMGATPNAMANMKAVTNRFGPSVKAFFIVPIVGSLFIDFINATIITLFMNFV